MNAVGTRIGGNTGAPDLVGDEGVAEGIVDRVLGEVSSLSSEEEVGVSSVVTFLSDGKKVLMTGLERRPTRPSCTALDVVLAVRRGVGLELSCPSVCLCLLLWIEGQWLREGDRGDAVGYYIKYVMVCAIAVS